MAVTLPTFVFRGRTIEVDVPHLAFATAIAGWCVWFCHDAWRAQHDVENLILIVPASAVAVVLYAAIAAGCFRAKARDDAGAVLRPPLERGVGVRIAGTMALLAGYASTGPLIGFDLATFAYVLVMLLFLGERRVVVLLLVPTLFCAIVVYCFGTILATPLPLFFFGNDAS